MSLGWHLFRRVSEGGGVEIGNLGEDPGGPQFPGSRRREWA